MSESDDDALRWAGDEPEAERSAARATRSARPSASEIADAGRASGSGWLVVYGILVGMYALFTVGWVIGIVRDPYSQATLFAEIMYQFGEFLAIASPAAWFVTVLVLTRSRPDRVRVGWLALGAALLVPWPFVLGVG